MKGHGLNYPEANSSKDSLFENQPSICSTLQPTWTLVQERENTGGLAITEAHGAFCTWHNQDQVHPKMKQWQAGESFTPCLWQFLSKCRVSRVLCESGLFFCVRYAIVFALSFYPPFIHFCFSWSPYKCRLQFPILLTRSGEKPFWTRISSPTVPHFGGKVG